ncbi:MAG: hypothetical protein KY463_12875, partial [Actinobacteria bacterium]|nr:hypothetical protein [Actinomycetota bacterium]
MRWAHRRPHSRRAARGALAALVALWAGVAFAVGLASAAQTTIGFDDLADATVVTDQYADRGVVFGTRGARDRVEVRSDDSSARSAPNVASFGNCAVVMDVVRCTNRATGHLSTPATAVSLYVGSIDPEPGGDSRDVVLEGFAADGSSIARDVVRVQPAAPFTHPLTVAAAAGSTIVRFEIHLATLETTNARLGFDDLTITTADVSTAPTTTTPPATTPPATTTPATTPRPPASALRIGGPQRLALNAPARFVALEAPTTARVHEWDLDGDGSYERNTAAHPAVDHGFTRAGRVVVGLRTTHDDGRQLAATLAVDVDRPPVVGLAFSPAYPKAGDSVSFNVQQRTESGRRFSLFAWNFFGLKPRDEDIRVRPTAGSGPRRAARAGADAPTVKLDGAQPTTRPNLTRRLTKKGPQKIEVAAITTDGDRTRLHTSIGMSGTANAKVPPVVDCDKDTTYSGPCAGIAVSEPAAVGIKTFFTAALSEVEACLPSNFKVTSAPDRALKHVKAKVDLPYPSPQAFGAGGVQQGIAATRARSASHRGSPRVGSQRARAAQIQYECVVGRSSVLQWDLGGGTKIPATVGGAADSAPGTVSKTYATAGKVTVSLLARIAYLEPCAPICAGKGSANIAEKFVQVKHFVARKTIVIDVITPVCGVQKLNSIPISTFVAGGGTDARGAAGCFIPTTSLDNKQQLLKPFPGYGVDLNTVQVASGGEILIDPKSGQIFVPPESNWPLTVTPPIALSPYGGQLTMSGGRVLNVPPPTIDPGLKRRVTKLVLPSSQLLGQLGGLQVREYDLLLSPDSAAYHRLYLGVPKPLGGGDPPIVLGGSQQTVGAASTAAEDLDTDFELNLADKDLGFLHLKTFMLKHRRTGGWLGGGRLQIPSLNDLEVIADYKRPQPSDKCLIPGQKPPNDVPGPSGISLTASGGFEFGGFALKPGPGTFVIGPVEVTCIGVRGQADPLVLQGLATLEVPAGAPTIYVDGCLGLASLDEDEDASVCGSSIEKKHPKLVWFRASAAIDLLRKLPLADAYFDLRRGGGTTRIGFGANANVDVFDLGVVRLKGGIAGQIVVQPKFAFEVFGQVGICGSIVDFVNAALEAGTLGFANPPACYTGQAIISSKGGAACIKDFVGGYIYWKPEIKIVTGCDLEQDDSLRIS